MSSKCHSKLNETQYFCIKILSFLGINMSIHYYLKKRFGRRNKNTENSDIE